MERVVPSLSLWEPPSLWPTPSVREMGTSLTGLSNRRDMSYLREMERQRDLSERSSLSDRRDGGFPLCHLGGGVLCVIYDGGTEGPSVSCTADPTWGDIFECCFKAQSSKLECLFSLKRGKRDFRALSFELSKMSPQVGLAVPYLSLFSWHMMGLFRSTCHLPNLRR